MTQNSIKDFNIRRDLVAFMEYSKVYDMKRSHRENTIAKPDLKRLAKLLKAPHELQENEAEEGNWTETISSLALAMGLVLYDTEGEYAFYSSQDRTYPDNYIKVNEDVYERYLAKNSMEKELCILAALLKNTPNEFHHASSLGSQVRFSTRGSAVNGASKMDLPQIRTRLLEILAKFDIDTPIPFISFVQKVKKSDPNLILSKWSQKLPKYYCFYAHKYQEIEIADADPDAYEKVEGRYLAYFLEELPVLMQFISLEYDAETSKGSDGFLPPCSFIKSFTLSKKCKALLIKDIAYLNHVKITATPDFRVFIESTLYPEQAMILLAPYTEEILRDTHMITLELNGVKTVKSLAANAALPSPEKALQKLKVDVPKNVAIDSATWMAKADKFLVYENIALLEVDLKSPALRKKIIEDE